MSFEYVVETEDLTKYYQMGPITVKALESVNLRIKRGEYISIMGPSGSGKTTLFNMVGGIDRPTRGRVYVDGVDIAKLDAYELAWLRCRKIGYIFQTFNLIPVMSALENVTLPMIFAGLTPDDYLPKGAKMLKLVSLGDRLHHKPFELSGGQQQRVAIARSLANDPAIVLADEPTGNLDLKTGRDIIALLRNLNKKNGVTVISATHDLKMIDVSDRIFWIRDGKIAKIEERGKIKLSVGGIKE
jgi:putative ABC transport system ATP-binding protein